MKIIKAFLGILISFVFMSWLRIFSKGNRVQVLFNLF